LTRLTSPGPEHTSASLLNEKDGLKPSGIQIHVDEVNYTHFSQFLKPEYGHEYDLEIAKNKPELMSG
jgi:hypothetical protein